MSNILVFNSFRDTWSGELHLGNIMSATTILFGLENNYAWVKQYTWSLGIFFWWCNCLVLPHNILDVHNLQIMFAEYILRSNTLSTCCVRRETLWSSKSYWFKCNLSLAQAYIGFTLMICRWNLLLLCCLCVFTVLFVSFNPIQWYRGREMIVLVCWPLIVGDAR